MPTTTAELQANLSEYHVAVAEVVGGMSSDLIELRQKVELLEEMLSAALGEIETLKSTAMLLARNAIAKNEVD